MANADTTVLVDIQGNAQGINKAASQAKSSVRSVGEEADRTKSRGSSIGEGFRAGGAIVAAGVAVGAKALYNFGRSSVQTFNGVQSNITKFQQVAQNAGWSDSLQRQSVHAFGVIGIGASRTAATTAAAMGLTADSFNRLQGPMGDLAVKIGGVTGASDAMGTVSMQVSKAIATGSTSRLARYGVVLDENTQKTFKNADQQQRAQILADALNRSVGGLNQRLSQTPSGQMQQLSNSILAVKSNFGGLLEGSVTPDAFIKSVTTMVDQGVRLFTTMAPRLAEGVGAMATAVAQAAPQMITGLIQGLMPALPTLISAIATAIPQVVQAIASAIPQIIQAIMTALPQIIQGMIALVLALVQALPQIIQALITAIPTIIQDLIAAFLNNLPQIIQGGIQLVLALVAALPQIISALIQAVPEIISALVQAVIVGGPQLIAGFGQIFTQAADQIKVIFGPIGQWFGQVWQVIMNWFSGAGSWFGGVFTAARNGVMNAFGPIGGWFGQVWASITRVFGGAGGWFAGVGRAIWGGITGALSGLGGWFAGLWQGIANGVWGAVSGIVGTFRSLGSQIWAAIRGGLRSVLGSVPVVGGAIISALHLAKGGIVTGIGSTTADNQLAALSPGEYVVNASAARSIGYDAMDTINRTGRIPTISNDDHRATINVQTNGTDPLAIAQQLGRLISIA